MWKRYPFSIKYSETATAEKNGVISSLIQFQFQRVSSSSRSPRANPGARGFTLTNRVEYKPSLSIGRGTRPHPRCHAHAITATIHHEVLLADSRMEIVYILLYLGQLSHIYIFYSILLELLLSLPLSLSLYAHIPFL